MNTCDTTIGEKSKIKSKTNNPDNIDNIDHIIKDISLKKPRDPFT